MSDFPFAVRQWPRLREQAGLAGIAGRIKENPEDFVVEEIPAYRPAGVGPHLWLWIEKRDVSAEQLLRHLSRVLHVPVRDIGMAGLKDRQAITRQYVSVPEAAAAHLDQVETEQIRVLHAVRHQNKLRRGHLKGNRFRIVVRDAGPEGFDKAEALLGLVQREGFPNYFGWQRFGLRLDTLRVGYEVLAGIRAPEELPEGRRHFLLRIGLSAVQAWLFNEVVARRLASGTLRRVQAGDIMQVVASGGCFRVEDVAVEQQRCDRWETVITGPMFGPKMLKPSGAPAALEKEVLTAYGIDEQRFAAFPRLTTGTRRPLMVRPEGVKLAHAGGDLVLEFALPSGCYATCLLREVLQEEPAGVPDV